MTTNCFVGIIVFRFGKKIVKKGFYGEKKINNKHLGC